MDWPPFRHVAVCSIAVLFASTASAQPLHTTEELKAMPPAAADRVVRKDLLSILEPMTQSPSPGMLRVLRGVPLATRPYGTPRFSGLCEQDTVSVKYAPTDRTSKPADWRLQPYGIEGHAFFHALNGRPTLASLRDTDNVWSSECDRLGGLEEIWFEAKNADEAAQAVTVFQMMLDQIRSGALHPTSCYIPNAVDCEKTIASEADVHRMMGVDTCPHVDGEACFAILTDRSIQFTIHARLDADRRPAAITAVSAELEIIVT